MIIFRRYTPPVVEMTMDLGFKAGESDMCKQSSTVQDVQIYTIRSVRPCISKMNGCFHLPALSTLHSNWVEKLQIYQAHISISVELHIYELFPYRGQISQLLDAQTNSINKYFSHSNTSKLETTLFVNALNSIHNHC